MRVRVCVCALSMCASFSHNKWSVFCTFQAVKVQSRCVFAPCMLWIWRGFVCVRGPKPRFMCLGGDVTDSLLRYACAFFCLCIFLGYFWLANVVGICIYYISSVDL